MVDLRHAQLRHGAWRGRRRMILLTSEFFFAASMLIMVLTQVPPAMFAPQVPKPPHASRVDCPTSPP